MTSFASYLKEARTRQGLTQREVAEAAGVDISYISKIESGRLTHTPSPQALASLARVLEVEELELLDVAGKLPGSLSFATLPEARAFLEAARQHIETPDDWRRLTEIVSEPSFRTGGNR